MKKLIKAARITSVVAEIIALSSIAIVIGWAFRNCSEFAEPCNDSIWWYVIPLIIGAINLYLHVDAENFLEENKNEKDL